MCQETNPKGGLEEGRLSPNILLATFSGFDIKSVAKCYAKAILRWIH